MGPWLDTLETRAPINVVVTAAANKLARIAWAVLSSGQDYRAAVSGNYGSQYVLGVHG